MKKIQKDITEIFLGVLLPETNLDFVNAAQKMADNNLKKLDEGHDFNCRACCDAGFYFDHNEFYVPDSDKVIELPLKVMTCLDCDTGLDLANDPDWKI